MGSRRVNIALLCAPVMLVALGCASLRLPAIDPSGRRIFLPRPNASTLARDGLFGSLHGEPGLRPQSIGAAANSPYEPAFSNRHRGKLGSLLHGDWLHSSRGQDFGTMPGSEPAFVSPDLPPLCGPNGLAPDGSPCFPIGSPSQSSLDATLPPFGDGFAPVGTGLLAPGASANSLTQYSPGVVLKDEQLVASIGEEVVVLGGVRSPSGIFRPNELVRWSLSNNSAGTILDAHDAQRPAGKQILLGLLKQQPNLPVCGDCVFSRTSSRCDVLVRQALHQQDDIFLSRGQTWVSLTSGSEGVSYVTLSAPQLESCNRRHATARIIWVDGQWKYPAPSQSSLEGPAQLSTLVARQSDQSPLPGWTVRYAILDGPAATINQSGATSIDVPTDAQGRAIVNLYPTTTETGTTRVRVQIIKPGSPGEPSQYLVGDGMAYVTWTELGIVTTPTIPPTDVSEFPPTGQPQLPSDFEPPAASPATQSPTTGDTSLSIDVRGPGSVTRGGPARYQVLVRNTGPLVATNVEVRSPFASTDFELDRSIPQAFVDARQSQYIWRLGNLRPNEAVSIDATYVLGNRSELVFGASAQNAPRVDDGIITSVMGDAIRVTVSEPRPFSPLVGTPVTFDIRIENLTNQPIEVNLVDRYDAGLEPQLEGNVAPDPDNTIRMRQSLVIPPGPSDPIPLTFIARQPGTFSHQVQVETKSGEKSSAIGTVRVQDIATPAQPQVSIDLQGDTSVDAGAESKVQVRVTNRGTSQLTGLQVQYRWDEDLRPIGATDGYDNPPNGFVLAWRVEPMAPGTSVTIDLRFQANPNPLKAIAPNSVRVVNAQGDVLQQRDFEIEIREPDGTAGGGFRIDPNDRQTNVESRMAILFATIRAQPAVRVQETIDYEITIENRNDRSYRDVYLTLQIGDGMEFAATAEGPRGTNPIVRDKGLLVEFDAIREIRPGERLVYRAKARSRIPGEATIVARVDAVGLQHAAIVRWQTTIR